jgi:renalase
MRIAIIGAGISGLTAGRELSKAGHEVTIIEKSRGLGGRLATRYAGKNLELKLDHGTPYFSVQSPEFSGFISELLDKNMIKIWQDNNWQYDGVQLLDTRPNSTEKIKYIAVEGMNKIGKYLARWVDVYSETKAGGLTYFGDNRSKKRPWMVNLTDFNTFEADAVIVATPAPQAYGIIQTSQDEVSTLKLIREIDEVEYDSTVTLLAGYPNAEIPEWDLITCEDDIIQTVSNESSKRNGKEELTVVVHSTPEFATHNSETLKEELIEKLLDRLSHITGNWAATPDWNQIHFWRYAKTRNPIKRPYMEVESLDAPLALVGDYFNGNTVDDAYCSGFKLARHWIDKFNHS